MNFEHNIFLFLGYYIPLPLSALKLIEIDINHPFRQINEISKNEIYEQLNLLNKKPGVSIKEIEVKVTTIQNLLRQNVLEKIEEALNVWKNQDISFISYFDNKYPKNLKVIKNPPKVIFYKGKIEIIYRKAVSIIGTRKPTDYGLSMTFKISKRFAELGFTIVNGFAKGIDTEAVKGALEVGGNFIGVMGSGLLNPYPKANLNLFEDIIEKDRGVFISEQLPENSITKSRLARRNRISSALSLGNIFIEGKKSSGTRYQLDFGKEQGKPTVVLRPKENSEQSYLPNYIIKNQKDCFIIEDIEDVDHISNSILEIDRKKKVKDTEIVSKQQKSLTDF